MQIYEFELSFCFDLFNFMIYYVLFAINYLFKKNKMDSLKILSNLKVDLSIRSRTFARNTILDSQINAKELIHFIKISTERTQVLFICVLDYIIDEYPDFLANDLDLFINLQETFTNETCKRCTSRIIFNLLKYDATLFSKKQKDKLIDIHFDWLIKNSLVATRVNCLSVLFELRNEADWIKPELVAIIDQQMQLNEASFVSRAKKIMKKIHKEAK